jgi:hypothetical protein
MAFTISGTNGINLGTQPLTGVLPDANAPSGSVIQVVSDTGIKTTITTTSTSYQTLGYEVTITPRSASNKLVVFWEGFHYISSNRTAYIAVGDGSNNILSEYPHTTWAGSSSLDVHTSGSYVLSPNTASPYTVRLICKSDGVTAVFNANRSGSLIVMEIAG